MTDIAGRFGAFVAERHPFALADALEAFEKATGGRELQDEDVDRRGASGVPARAEEPPAGAVHSVASSGPDAAHLRGACDRRTRSSLDACDGFLRRAAIEASLTPDERLEILRGMVLTRAIDNRLKTFFTGGEVRYGGDRVPGQGLSLARPGSDLRRGDAPAPRRRPIATPTAAGRATSIGPMIRDLGVALAMRPEPATVRMVLNAQMGKAGPPMDGKDLHIGDFAWGILPPAAPLTIADADDRRHGDGVRARRIASASPSRSSARADRRSASGTRRSISAPRAGCRRSSASRTTRPRCRRRSPISRPCACSPTRRRATACPASRIDGTDPDAIAGGVRLGGRARARRARADAHRARRDAHVRPRPSRRHALSRPRSADVVGHIRRWPSRATPTASSTSTGPRAIRSRSTRRGWRPKASSRPGDLDRFKHEADALVETEARAVIDAPWPEPAQAGDRRVRRTKRAARARVEVARSRDASRVPTRRVSGLRRVDASSPRRRSIRRAARSSTPSMLGVGDALRADPRVFVYGEDVGGQYGNAFLLLRPLLEGVRRSHHQLAARRRRRARRLRRRGARRPAADRRDAVQRLRRDRLQSARQQRGEDPLPLGRRACRWSCACRGAACATPARITRRTPRRGSTARRA